MTKDLMTEAEITEACENVRSGLSMTDLDFVEAQAKRCAEAAADLAECAEHSNHHYKQKKKAEAHLKAVEGLIEGLEAPELSEGAFPADESEYYNAGEAALIEKLQAQLIQLKKERGDV